MAEVNVGGYNEQASLQAIVNLQQGNLGQPLQAGLNLSDVTDKVVARANLGVGIGTTTNDNAAAGYVGELQSANLVSGSAVPIAVAGVPQNIVSVSLTAGDWDVSGVTGFNLSSATTTTFFGGVSMTSNALPTDINYFREMFGYTIATDTLKLPTPLIRISLATTTIVYLIGTANFSAGSITMYGTIRARRVR